MDALHPTAFCLLRFPQWLAFTNECVCVYSGGPVRDSHTVPYSPIQMLITVSSVQALHCIFSFEYSVMTEIP